MNTITKNDHLILINDDTNDDIINDNVINY